MTDLNPVSYLSLLFEVKSMVSLLTARLNRFCLSTKFELIGEWGMSVRAFCFPCLKTKELSLV